MPLIVADEGHFNKHILALFMLLDDTDLLQLQTQHIRGLIVHMQHRDDTHALSCIPCSNDALKHINETWDDKPFPEIRIDGVFAMQQEQHKEGDKQMMRVPKQLKFTAANHGKRGAVNEQHEQDDEEASDPDGHAVDLIVRVRHKRDLIQVRHGMKHSADYNQECAQLMKLERFVERHKREQEITVFRHGALISRDVVQFGDESATHWQQNEGTVDIQQTAKPFGDREPISECGMSCAILFRQRRQCRIFTAARQRIGDGDHAVVVIHPVRGIKHIEAQVRDDKSVFLDLVLPTQRSTTTAKQPSQQTFAAATYARTRSMCIG
mmetsp:Transcript_17929/g.28317  ORF Transcript_17929/g.28317 Transcript_17929/m.28317 type:complete len:323 (+) Transcript_17929:981-1949(+)